MMSLKFLFFIFFKTICLEFRSHIPIETILYIYILKHFVGTPSNILSQIYDYLNNLRCPTMFDYRWYIPRCFHL